MYAVLILTLLILGAIRFVVAPVAVDVVESTSCRIHRHLSRHHREQP